MNASKNSKFSLDNFLEDLEKSIDEKVAKEALLEVRDFHSYVSVTGWKGHF